MTFKNEESTLHSLLVVQKLSSIEASLNFQPHSKTPQEIGQNKNSTREKAKFIQSQTPR